MATWKHSDWGTVIETTADPGPGWERADSQPADDQAPKKEPVKRAPKKTAPKE